VIDLDEFTHKYWGLLSQHAYRLTGSILDAEDITQETMLRVVEMGPSIENIKNHYEWLHVVATEAAVGMMHKPIPVEEFDLPDLIQTTGAGADPDSRPVGGEAGRPGVTLDFLFPIQYMAPEQRAVVVLRDGFEDGDRVAASALQVTIQEVFKIAGEAENTRAAVRKRWGSTVPFVPLAGDGKTEKVFDRFLEVFRMKDAVLLQQLVWKNAEMVLETERTTGQDFVAKELSALSKGMGSKLKFDPIWLNGCRGVLISDWRAQNSEWLRMALGLVLCNEREVRALKWYLDGHILRKIQVDES
jgi:RNA polymerase sigma-70 factor (ECF subfamily)